MLRAVVSTLRFAHRRLGVPARGCITIRRSGPSRYIACTEEERAERTDDAIERTGGAQQFWHAHCTRDVADYRRFNAARKAATGVSARKNAMAQRTKERKTLNGGLPASVSLSILLIDDDDDSRDVLLYQLSLEGYRCRGAATGMAGVRIARESTPDVILLDLNLPDIHGHEVIQLMRAEPTLAATPIVVISGERSIVAARAISLGATASHSEPLDFGELLETLNSLEPSSPQPSA